MSKLVTVPKYKLLESERLKRELEEYLKVKPITKVGELGMATLEPNLDVYTDLDPDFNSMFEE